MRLQYHLTFDDYLDAVGGHAQRTQRIARAGRPRMWKVVKILLLVDVVLMALLGAVTAIIALNSSGQSAVSLFQEIARYHARDAFAILPWIGVLIVLVVGGVMQRRPRRAFRVLAGTWLLWVCAGAALCVLAIPDRSRFLNLPESVTSWQLSGIRNVDVAGWVFMSLFWLLMLWTVVGQPRRLWKQQGNLLRPKTLDIDADGVTVTDECSRMYHQWAGIEKVVDTPSAVLIYVNGASFHIVPKRAFTFDEALDEFWQLAHEKGESPAKGFAVLAGAKPAAE